MSGGIALRYFDVKCKIYEYCNKEMVDLDPLNDEDYDRLRQMVSRHCEYTGSTVACFIMNDFENQKKNFVKVFPKDYKKALEQQKALQAASVR